MCVCVRVVHSCVYVHVHVCTCSVCTCSVCSNMCGILGRGVGSLMTRQEGWGH